MPSPFPSAALFFFTLMRESARCYRVNDRITRDVGPNRSNALEDKGSVGAPIRRFVTSRPLATLAQSPRGAFFTPAFDKSLPGQRQTDRTPSPLSSF